MTTNELRDFLKKHCSNRAAEYVACVFLGQPLTRKAQEHLNRNGGQPSDRATTLLNWCQSKGTVAIEQRLAWRAERAEMESEVEWDELSALQLCNSAAYDAEISTLAAAGQEWWKKEGQYEEKLEDSGEYKYYLYAADRAAQEGRELTAREFYLGGE